MNDKTAVLIAEEEEYQGGANYPSIVKRYRCACGVGEVVETRLPGFGERYVDLRCEACKEAYKIVEGCGYIWELKSK